jgi:hypothetical protein
MELSAVAVAVANKGMVALISCIGYLNNNFFIFTRKTGKFESP